MLFDDIADCNKEQQYYDEILSIILSCNSYHEKESTKREISLPKPFVVPQSNKTKWVHDVYTYIEEIKNNTFKRHIIKEEPFVNMDLLEGIDFFDALDDATLNYTKARLLNRPFTWKDYSINLGDFIYQNLDTLNNKVNGRCLFGYWAFNEIHLPEKGQEIYYYWNAILSKGVLRETLNSFWYFFNFLGIKEYGEKQNGLYSILELTGWSAGKGYSNHDRVVLCYLEYLNSINYNMNRIPLPKEDREVFSNFILYLEGKYNISKKVEKKRKVKPIDYKDLFNE